MVIPLAKISETQWRSKSEGVNMNPAFDMLSSKVSINYHNGDLE